MTTIRQLQEHVCERLRETPGLSQVSVTPTGAAPADRLAARIEEALAGALPGYQPGCALLVATPRATCRRNCAGRVWLDPVRVEVTAFTRPALADEGDAPCPEDLAVAAARALAGWTPPGCTRPLSAEGEVTADNGDGAAAATAALATAADCGGGFRQ